MRYGLATLREVRRRALARVRRGLLQAPHTAIPAPEFLNDYYRRHNQRRQEHLASLGLDLHGRTVLELGAGIGDHTSFFIDRRCSVVTSDARTGNVAALRARFTGLEILQIDLDRPGPDLGRRFDILYCYGLLYHLARPADALAFMARHAAGMLLLETCVSFGDEPRLELCAEAAADPTQALHGTGCRPTRSWVFRELSSHFEHVYMPQTQPCHEEFPLDWRNRAPNASRSLLARAVFVASRVPLDSSLLCSGIPEVQRPG